MKVVFSFMLLFFCFQLNGQIVQKISLAEKIYSRDSLQEKYFDRIFSEEITICFDVNQEVLFREWSKFSMDVARFIHEKRFLWGGQTQAQIEVFFNQSGKIDLFLIEIDTPTFQESKYQELFKLLLEFSKTYKFSIVPKVPFSSVGSITFYD